MINTSSEDSFKTSSSNLNPEKLSRTRNGPVNRRNTTKPHTLLKRRNRSSVQPSTLHSYRRMPRWAKLLSLNSPTTSPPLPKNRNSPDNHGLPSSTSSLPSLPLPQSRLTRTPSNRLLISANSSQTKLLSPEKSKEETTNIGLMNTREPRTKSLNNSTILTVKSPTWNRKSLPSPRESRLPPMKETNSWKELNRNLLNMTSNSDYAMTRTSTTPREDKPEWTTDRLFLTPSHYCNLI